MQLINFLVTKLFKRTIDLKNLNPDDVNEPIKNFDALWRELKQSQVDLIGSEKQLFWKKKYTQYRSQITSTTSNKELFKISSDLIKELNDGHSLLHAKFDEEILLSELPYLQKFKHGFYSYEMDKISEDNFFLKRINSTLVQNGFHPPKNDSVPHYHTVHSKSDKCGYLCFAMYKSQGEFIDRLISDYFHLDALIIDLRYNRGGSDNVAFKIAKRFITEKGTLYYKQERKKGQNKLSRLKAIKLNSTTKKPFTKKVILLTSDATASSLEVFLLSLKGLPNVTVIGDKTEGILSDIRYFSLPNSWLGMTSTCNFFSKELVCCEKIGLEPDHYYHLDNDDQENQDKLILKALELIETS